MKRVAKFKPVTPDLRQKMKRYLVLADAHIDAIRGGDQSFYDDGRHEELLQLVSDVHPALGIKPWEDALAIVGAALNGARKSTAT